jgi:hypothetical protein
VLGAPAGDEDAGLDDDAQSAELRPAHHLLQRMALDAAPDQGVQFVGGGGGVDQQAGLVLGEYASGGAQAGGDAGQDGGGG